MSDYFAQDDSYADYFGYGDSQDLTPEQFFGYEAPPPRRRLADEIDAYFAAQERRQRLAPQQVDYGYLDRQARRADTADQGDEGDLLSWADYKNNVDFDRLDIKQQQAEYDYYVDKIAGSRVPPKDLARLRQEFGKAVPRPAPERSVADYAKDIGLDFAAGSADLINSLTGRLDIVTGGVAGQYFRDNIYNPKDARTTLEGMQSEARQQARRNVQASQDPDAGFGTNFKNALVAGAENPSEIVGLIAGTVPQMAESVLGGRALLALRGINPATATAAQLRTAAAVAEGFAVSGSVAAEIRESNPENRLNMYYALPAGVLSGLAGRYGGNVEAALMGPAARRGLAQNRAVSGFVQGSLEGGEELTQEISEQFFTNLGTGKAWDDGLAFAGAMGLLAGGTMGAVGGVALPGTPNEAGPATPSTPATPGATPSPAGPFGPGDETVTTADIDEINAAFKQDAETVSEIVDSTLRDTVTPVVDAELKPTDTRTGLLEQANVALEGRRLSEGNRTWVNNTLMEIDTLPDADDRQSAYKIVLDAIENRLETTRDSLGPNHWLFVVQDLVTRNMASEGLDRPVATASAPATAAPRPVQSEISTPNEVLAAAMLQNPEQTIAIMERTDLTTDQQLDLMLEVAYPTQQAQQATQVQQAAQPTAGNFVDFPNEVVENSRQNRTEQARRAVLDELMEKGTDESTLSIAFSQALIDKGFNNPQPSPAELRTMQRYADVTASLRETLADEKVPDIDNSSMEAAIKEAGNPLAAPAVVEQTKQQYTASLSPEQIGFVKNVIREAATRGVTIARSRDELMAVFNRSRDPRVRSLAAVDMGRIYKLGDMVKEARKQLGPKKRNPPKANPRGVTPDMFGEGGKAPAAKRGRSRSNPLKVEQEELFAQDQSALEEIAAEEVEPPDTEARVLTQRETLAVVRTALINTGIYQGKDGVASMQADVAFLMEVIELESFGDTYPEAVVRNTVQNIPTLLGGATLEMAAMTPSIVNYQHVHNDALLSPTKRAQVRISPQVQPRHRALIQMLVDNAVSMMPNGVDQLVSEINYTLTNASASYQLGTRRLQFNSEFLDSILDSSLNGEKDPSSYLQTAVATVLHELQHAVDRRSDNSLNSAMLPEFDMQYVLNDDGTVGVEGVGAIMREAADAERFGVDAGSLAYPFTTLTYKNEDGEIVRMEESRLKAEVFAQLGRLYYSNRALLSEISPTAVQFFGEIYGNKQSIAESVARLQGKVPSERASRPGAGQVTGVSEKVADYSATGPGNRPAGSELARPTGVRPGSEPVALSEESFTPAILASVQVKGKAFNENTGQIELIDTTAAEALDSVREDIQALKQLLRCLGA